MTAIADSTFHVALQRNVDRLAGHCTILERTRGEAHHHLGATDHGNALVGIEIHPLDELRHDADVSSPIGSSVIDRDVDGDIEVALPALELLAEQDLLR